MVSGNKVPVGVPSVAPVVARGAAVGAGLVATAAIAMTGPASLKAGTTVGAEAVLRGSGPTALPTQLRLPHNVHYRLDLGSGGTVANNFRSRPS